MFPLLPPAFGAAPPFKRRDPRTSAPDGKAVSAPPPRPRLLPLPQPDARPLDDMIAQMAAEQADPAPPELAVGPVEPETGAFGPRPLEAPPVPTLPQRSYNFAPPPPRSPLAPAPVRDRGREAADTLAGNGIAQLASLLLRGRTLDSRQTSALLQGAGTGFDQKAQGERQRWADQAHSQERDYQAQRQTWADGTAATARQMGLDRTADTGTLERYKLERAGYDAAQKGRDKKQADEVAQTAKLGAERQTFLKSLPGLDPATQQTTLKLMDEAGELKRLGLSFPKDDATGAYTLPAFHKAPPKSPEEVKAVRLEKELAQQYRMFTNPRLTDDGVDKVGRRINQIQAALGYGDGTPQVGALLADFTPAQQAQKNLNEKRFAEQKRAAGVRETAAAQRFELSRKIHDDALAKAGAVGGKGGDPAKVYNANAKRLSSIAREIADVRDKQGKLTKNDPQGFGLADDAPQGADAAQRATLEARVKALAGERAALTAQQKELGGRLPVAVVPGGSALSVPRDPGFSTAGAQRALRIGMTEVANLRGKFPGLKFNSAVRHGNTIEHGAGLSLDVGLTGADRTPARFHELAASIRRIPGVEKAIVEVAGQVNRAGDGRTSTASGPHVHVRFRKDFAGTPPPGKGSPNADRSALIFPERASHSLRRSRDTAGRFSGHASMTGQVPAPAAPSGRLSSGRTYDVLPAQAPAVPSEGR